MYKFFNKTLLYFHTIKYLKVHQIIGQFKKYLFKTKRKIICTRKVMVDFPDLIIPELDLNSKFIERFNTTEILNNTFSFLGQKRELDLSTWEVQGVTPLWLFNLHYFEYAIPMAVETANNRVLYNKFKELYISWQAAFPQGKDPGWNSYVISMRLINLLIAIKLWEKELKSDTVFMHNLYYSLYEQYCYLKVHQEKHLLGNHYFENIKALYICSVAFLDLKTQRYAAGKLKEQLKEQILADGVHFELSILYHKIIMEDLLRILCCCSADLRKEIIYNLKKMSNALFSLEYGMGKMPFFNDAGEGIAKNSKDILNVCERLTGEIPKKSYVFDKSGYYKLEKDNISVIFDCGPIGPSYIPGHGHCDALSFELASNNVPIFVNSGTYSYQGNLRPFFRSTAAHNTVLINGQEQSECWAEHRVARRITNIHCTEIPGGYRGQYTNFKGDTHIRRLFFREEEFHILDDIVTDHPCDIQSFLHLAPGLVFESASNSLVYVRDNKGHIVCRLGLPSRCQSAVHTDDVYSNYSPSFGTLEKKQALEIIWNSRIKGFHIIIKF